MRIRGVAGLTARRLAWQITRSPAVGRPLVDALGSDDETVQGLAGMMLTRAGRSAEPLLLEALERRENVPVVLHVLAGIGDETAERTIQSYLSDPDPEVVDAAESAEKVVRMQRQLDQASG